MTDEADQPNPPVSTAPAAIAQAQAMLNRSMNYNHVATKMRSLANRTATQTLDGQAANARMGAVRSAIAGRLHRPRG